MAKEPYCDLTAGSFTAKCEVNGESLYPVITGHKTDPKRLVITKRDGPAAGSGNYYKYSRPFRPSATAIKRVNSYCCDSIDLKYTDQNGEWRAYSDGIHAEWYRYDERLGYALYSVFRYDSIDRNYIYCYGEASYSWERFANRKDFEDRLAFARVSLSRHSRPLYMGERNSVGDDVPAAIPDLDAFLAYTELGLLKQEYSLAAAAAYHDHATRIPVTVSNGIANILESAEVITSLVTRRGFNPHALLDPRNAWLAYRYSYNTSKSDIDDYITLTKRLTDIVNFNSVTVCGYYSTPDGVRVKCTCHYRPQDLLPDDISSWLRAYGIKVSLLNVWDMIPYSFVADWFLHIGDFLEFLDYQGQALSLRPSEVWYSFSRNISEGEYSYWRIKDGPRYNAPYIDTHTTSTKTHIMRLADTISLFT